MIRSTRSVPIESQKSRYSASIFQARGEDVDDRMAGDTVDGSEIRRSPVEVGRLSHYLQGFIRSQVVQDFFHQPISQDFFDLCPKH